MAKRTIKQRISLDGGKEMQAELKALGTAGEKAFGKIQQAAKSAEFARFGASLNAFGRDLATVGKRLAIGFTAISATVTAATAGIAALAKGGAEAADAAGKAAQATGLQIDAYGRLAFAAEQADVSQEQFTGAMSRLNRALGEAAAGGKKAVATFAALGVRIKDAKGRLRPTEDIVHDLAAAFSRMPDGAKKSAAAIELFGKSGASLLPFLNEGKQGLIDLGEQAERLGIVFTREQAAIGDAMGDALDEVSRSAGAIRNHLGLMFAPAITAGALALRDVIVGNRDAILRFARSLADTAIPLIEDFAAALTGRDTDVRNVWILEWRDAVVSFGTSTKNAVEQVIIPAFNAMRKTLDLAAGAVRAFTGINIDGASLAIVLAIGKVTGAFGLLRSSAVLAVNALRLVFAHPVVAGVTLVTTAFLKFLNYFENGNIAARAHADALDELKRAVDAVKAGIPGAQQALDELTKKNLAAAEAALENAKAQLELRRQALEIAERQQRDSFLGPMEKRLGLDVPPLEAKVEADIQNVDKALERIQEIRKVVAGVATGIAAIPETAAQTVTKSAEGATQKVQQLAKTITVHSSEGGKLVQKTFEMVDGVARAVETSKGNLDELTTKADEATTKVSDLARGIVSVPAELKGQPTPADALTDGLDEAGGKLQSTFDAVPGQARTAVDGVVSEVGRLAPAISAAMAGGTSDKKGEQEKSAGIAEAIVQPFQTARDRIAEILAAVPSLVGEMVAKIMEAAAQFGAGFGDALASPFQAMSDRITSILTGLASTVESKLASMIAAVQSAVTRFWAFVAEMESLSAKIPSGGAGRGRGYARGGHVSGPGTGTSDSILARLSNGEFVVTARAVRKYGVGLLSMLNNMQLPRDFLESLRGFSAGGVVSALTDGMRVNMATPAFAGGGAVSASSGRSINLTVGNETYKMIAPEDVADRLAKHIGRQGLRRAGKTPSWG